MAQWEYEKNQQTFFAYILIKAITVLSRKSPEIEKEFFASRKVPEGPRPYEVHLTVDGFELPLEEAFEEIERQMDEMVKREALDLLEERLGTDLDDRVEVFRDLVSQAADALRDQLNEKLGIVISDDGWHKRGEDE